MGRRRERERARALDLAMLQAEVARQQVEALRTELTNLHHELARRDVELVSALTRMTNAAEALVLDADRDREDRLRLARAVELLAMFAAAPPVSPAPTGPPIATATVGDIPAGTTVIGGSVDPGLRHDDPEPPAEPSPPAAPTTIDLTTDPAADLPVAPATRAETPLECEVHLQFGDRWITGFQIEETIHDGGRVQFRLRRRVDGWVLPELFAESEVRVFTQPIVESAPVPVRHWTTESSSSIR